MNWFKTTPVDWELIDKTILPSGFEQARAHGQIIKRCDDASSIFSKVVIYTFKDKLSGRIKQERHES